MSDTVSQDIINKISKLLALADTKRGATEAEAANAASMVQMLLQKHGLSLAEVAASGTVSNRNTDSGDAREKRTMKGAAMYAWQRELMMTLAETNFCRHFIVEEHDEKTGRKGKRHRLIGRTVNVIGTQLTYDYLVKTMKRLVSEAGHAPGTHNEKDYHYWLAGCTERLRERLQQRAREAREESEKAKRAEEARRKHPAYSGTGNALVVLSEVYGSEDDLNQDFLHGLEPGTTARSRAEYQNRADQAEDRLNSLIAQGISWDVAWYMVHMNMTKDRAEERYAQELRDKAEEEKREAKNAKKRKNTDSGPRWTKANERELEKRTSQAYQQGSRAAEDIGLDQQVEHDRKRRIG